MWRARRLIRFQMAERCGELQELNLWLPPLGRLDLSKISV